MSKKKTEPKKQNKKTNTKKVEQGELTNSSPSSASKKLPAQEWLEQYEEQFDRYLNYCKSVDWRYAEALMEEYNLQKGIVAVIIDRLGYFLKTFEMFKDYAFVDKFKDVANTAIMLFTDRCDLYIKDNDWTKIDSPKERAVEMERQTTIMKELSSVRDKYKGLSLNNEVDLSLPIYGDKAIPLMMENVVKSRFPQVEEIERQVKSAAMVRPVTGGIYDIVNDSTEFFLNMDKIPPYDPLKHYFEQPESTIQFFREEQRKFTEGITINGTFIHPWLYWHLNYFKTDIPMSVLKGTKHYNPHEQLKIIQPPLRDNEWFVAQLLKQAREENKAIFIFSSRRLAKTTMEASILSWTATNVVNSESMVIGGDEGDLVKLSKTIEIAFGNVHPAFMLPRNTNDWDSQIQFGLKDKAGLRIPYSDIFIRNVNGGRGKSTEKTAGASPATWICDEAGKFNVKPIYQASIPSFETPDGWRTNVILTATGGNNELSSSARSMLMSPEENKLLPMDWDLLESFVPEERLVTWDRRPFGIFMPAQMSFKQGIHKEKTTLGKWLKNPSTDLDKIEINVTEWEKSLEVLEKDRNLIKRDIDAYNKERMYYPIDPLESFLSTEDNPFCVKEAQEHYEELIRTGNHGKIVEVGWDNQKGGMNYTFSDKPRPEYPFGGGQNPDAPVIILEDPPEKSDFNFMYVAGLDHYKTAKSKESSSLGSLVIFKRNVNIDEWSNKVVCTYTSRPETMEKFNETCEILLDGYGAKCLQENTDISFQQHLIAKRKDALLLANGEDIAKAHIKATTVQANKYGLPPTKANQEYLFKLLQDYVNEWIDLGADELGNIIRVRGVTRINDLGILEEIINYYPGANVDRLISFSHALALARYYDSINLMPKVQREYSDDDIKRRNAMRNLRHSPYSRTYSPYSKRV